MNQESNSIDSHDVEELLSDRHFPAFPFKDEAWRGLFLNRDLHGLGGMPKGIFDAVITQLEARGAMPLWFVPAVTLRSGEDAFPCADIDGWGDILIFLAAWVSSRSITWCQLIDRFCFGLILRQSWWAVGRSSSMPLRVTVAVRKWRDSRQKSLVSHWMISTLTWQLLSGASVVWIDLESC